MKRLVVLLAVGVGCSSVRPTKARKEVDDLIAQRAGPQGTVPARPDSETQAAVRARVSKLIASPVTAESAVQVALLNNLGFQATLEALGVAQADLAEAGLLQNPVVGGELIISSTGNGFGGGLSITQSLLSVFLIPARRRVAKANLRQAIVTVGQSALRLVRDVKVAHAEAQAAQAQVKLSRQLVQAAEVSRELASRQLDAGNVGPLDLRLFEAALDHARIELADAQLGLIQAREQLTRLLGLWGANAGWTLAEPVAITADPAVELSELEQVAVRQRLDLSAARFEVESMEYALKLRRRGVFPSVEVGVTSGNEVGTDIGHEWVLGPSLSIELPLFNPGYADFARLRAYLRQATYELQQMAVVARSEVRVQRERYVVAQRKAEYYRDTVVPRHEQIVALTLRQYNAMSIGAYDLIESRERAIEAARDYALAVRDYRVARAELELAVGGFSRSPQGPQS